MNEINQRFKTIRKMLNKSQEQLAFELGISKQAVSNIENKKSMPSIALLNKLLIDYKINLNYLLAGLGDIFVQNDESSVSLKETIINEVEKYLDYRGIV